MTPFRDHDRQFQFSDRGEMLFENFRIDNVTCFFSHEHSRLSKQNNRD